MTARVIALPSAVEPVAPKSRFATEAERQAYFAGYADALADRADPETRWVFVTDAEVRAELVRRGMHLSAVS